MKGIYLELKVYLHPRRKLFCFIWNIGNYQAPQANVGMIC